MILSRVNFQPKDGTTTSQASIKKNKDKVPTFEEFIERRDYTGALTLIDFNSKTPSIENELWRAFCHFRLAEYRKAAEIYKRIQPDEKSGISTDDLSLFIACCRFYSGERLNETMLANYKGLYQALAGRITFYLQQKESMATTKDLTKDNDLTTTIQAKLSTGQIEDELYLAALYFYRNQFQDSIDIYKKVLLDKKNYLALNVYIALCYYKLDYYDVSQEVLELYLQQHPGSILAGNLKACNNYRLYNGAAAETELRNLIESFPPNFNYAKDLIRHNLVVFRNGEGAFQVLPLLLNTIPEARLNLVIYYLKNDKTDEAQQLFKDVEPKLPIEYILKAIIHANLGQNKGGSSHENIKYAQKYYNLVGGSAAECDTIQGRQCMASYYFLTKQFDDMVLYLSSIKSYFYNDDTFNFNYAQAKLATRAFVEAEEAFLMIENEKLKNDMIYVCGLIRCYIMNKRPNKAWDMFLQYQQSKEATLLLHLIANDCYKMGAFLTALKAFDLLEKAVDSKNPEYWEGKRGAAAGVFQLVYAKVEPIKNRFEPAAIVMGKEILPLERYNWLYHIHFVRNEYEVCIERMEKLNVESEYCLFLKGLIRLRQGDPKSALQQFNQLKSINNTTYIKAIARCLLILGKHQNVCDIIKEVGLKVAHNDWQLWTLYGYALLFLGATAQAKEAFQSALQSSNQVEPFIALAKCQITEMDFKSAIFVLRRATELSPNDIQLATKLGVLLYTTGIIAKGIEKILELDGQTSNPDLALTIAIGTILQEVKGDYDSALQRYRQLDVFECPSLWNNIGLCLASKSKFVAAITCLKKAFFLQPLDWRINYNLGLINLKLKQFASTFQYFKNAVSYCNMTNPNLLTLLAVCLEFLNDFPNALQAHQTACKATDTPTAIALINHALFLYNNDYPPNEESRDRIVELLMEFEKAWLKRKEKSNEFEENVMRTATMLADQLNLSGHLSWTKAMTKPKQPLEN